MPTVTYRGKWYTRPGRDPSIGEWIRGQARTVSQSWLNDNRHWLLKDAYVIEGEEPVHVDLGDDGIPDTGWTKARIMDWLDDQGSPVGGGYKTKTTLLSLVEGVLNPAPVEEAVVEVAEEVAEVPEVAETVDETEQE